MDRTLLETLFLGIVVVGAAALGFAYLTSVQCSECARRFRRKKAIRPTEAVSRPQSGLFDFFDRDTQFCSELCKAANEAKQELKCPWCGEPFPRGEGIRIEGICNLRCSTSFKAADGVKEERRRIIREDQ